MRSWYDIAAMRTVLQHGDNPEAVQFIDDYELATLDVAPNMTLEATWWCHLTIKLTTWTNAIHRYEDAAQPGPPADRGRRGEDG